MIEIYDALPERVRTLRLQHALTQVELAEQAGISVAALIRIEQGTHTPRPATIRKLARALGVKPVQLTTDH